MFDDSKIKQYYEFTPSFDEKDIPRVRAFITYLENLIEIADADRIKEEEAYQKRMEKLKKKRTEKVIIEPKVKKEKKSKKKEETPITKRLEELLENDC